MSTVELLTPQQAQERRDQILASVGGDEADLRERAEQYLLDARELAAFTQLQELDFLLAAA